MNGKEVASALRETLVSPNVPDLNLEPANIVDVVNKLAVYTLAVAKSITPTDALGSDDATGCHVGSLTEAVMGLTAGLCRIAESISDLADAVRDSSAD